MMNIYFPDKCFDIEGIAVSGQCFRMNRQDDGSFEVLANNHRLIVESQTNSTIQCRFDGSDVGFWNNYFDVKTDYSDFVSAVDPADVFLSNAAAFSKGIRILRQDLWEMIVSFLISQQNNIKRIRFCIENICRRYGEKIICEDGSVFYAFPTPEALAVLDDSDLCECNLGYRAKYVTRTAREVVDGSLDLDLLKKLDYETAKARLLQVYGIGKKVADCICLFGLHHLQAFPIDTHIIQILDRNYKDGFPFERYKGFEGVIQQYMFHYELNGSNK